MTPWILAALGLWVVQTLYAASFRSVLAPDPRSAIGDHLRGKDREVALSVHGGRAQRAQRNLLESLVVFLPVALLLEQQGTTGGLAAQGAACFVGARVLYVPAYHAAIYGLRSAVWLAAVIGLGMMVVALVA